MSGSGAGAGSDDIEVLRQKGRERVEGSGGKRKGSASVCSQVGERTYRPEVDSASGSTSMWRKEERIQPISASVSAKEGEWKGQSTEHDSMKSKPTNGAS